MCGEIHDQSEFWHRISSLTWVVDKGKMYVFSSTMLKWYLERFELKGPEIDRRRKEEQDVPKWEIPLSSLYYMRTFFSRSVKGISFGSPKRYVNNDVFPNCHPFRVRLISTRKSVIRVQGYFNVPSLYILQCKCRIITKEPWGVEISTR